MLTLAMATFAQNDIAKVKWVPIETIGEKITQTNAYLTINAAKTRITGNTGCNQMTGTVAIARRNIKFGPVATTRRACKLMAGSIPEDTFLQGLRDAVRYEQKDSFLVLYNRRNRAVLKFQSSKQGDDQTNSGLEGKKWMLESIGNRKTLVAISGVFIRFESEKHSAGGDTGCNVFGGTYKASGSSITITDVISTMRACIEDDKMQIERDLLEGLRTANRFAMEGGRLQLYRNSRLLLTLRPEPV